MRKFKVGDIVGCDNEDVREVLAVGKKCYFYASSIGEGADSIAHFEARHRLKLKEVSITREALAVAWNSTIGTPGASYESKEFANIVKILGL